MKINITVLIHTWGYKKLEQKQWETGLCKTNNILKCIEVN